MTTTAVTKTVFTVDTNNTAVDIAAALGQVSSGARLVGMETDETLGWGGNPSRSSVTLTFEYTHKEPS